jgi:hypothetical protein
MGALALQRSLTSWEKKVNNDSRNKHVKRHLYLKENVLDRVYEIQLLLGLLPDKYPIVMP